MKDYVKLLDEQTLKALKENLKDCVSEKLADIVVSHRYLSLFEKTCLLAMEELGKRRANGDEFDFEAYIEENLKKLPGLDFSSLPKPDFGSLIQMFKEIKNAK